MSNGAKGEVHNMKKRKETGPSPEGMQAQRRKAKRQLDDLKLYQMIQEKEFDLFQKDDYSYVGAKARAIDWSYHRLNSALQRIWADAKRDISNEDRRNAAKRDKEVSGGDDGGVHNGSSDGQKSD